MHITGFRKILLQSPNQCRRNRWPIQKFCQLFKHLLKSESLMGGMGYLSGTNKIITKECTYSLAWESHNADCRKSTRRIEPFELLYANVLQCVGWNSADVITSAIIISRVKAQPILLKWNWAGKKIESKLFFLHFALKLMQAQILCSLH